MSQGRGAESLGAYGWVTAKGVLSGAKLGEGPLDEVSFGYGESEVKFLLDMKI